MEEIEEPVSGFERNLLIIIIGGFILLFAGIFLYYDWDEISLSSNCYDKKQLMKTVHNGVVKRKYIDSVNHGAPAIDILEYNSTIEFQVSGDYYAQLWKSVAVGDTIIKKQGTLTFILLNKQKRDTINIPIFCSEL